MTQRVTYNFIWYNYQIMGHFSKAGNYWDQGAFYDCGNELGYAIVDLLIDHSKQADSEDKFMHGLENKKQSPKKIKSKVSNFLY